jgi:hypothetical protein
MPDGELERIAFDALTRELGADGLARFANAILSRRIIP